MARVLITGASGLIGSVVSPMLTADDTIYAVSRSGSAIFGASRTIALDLATSWSTDQLPGEIDTVVHLAQSEHFRDFPLRSQNIFDVNTSSTARLLDYARAAGAKKFVLASSGGVYRAGTGSLCEDDPVRVDGELGFYPCTKLCAELLASCYSIHFHVVCLRFFFVYGPGQQTHMLMPRLADWIRTGHPVTLRGQDGLRMNPVHVDDAALAVKKAMTVQGSHTINVAGPTVLSLREVADTIGKVVGRPPNFEVLPQTKPQDLIGSTVRMQRLLCEPRISFAAGISATLKRTET